MVKDLVAVTEEKIFRLNVEREQIAHEVLERELASKTRTPHELELVLNDVAFSEIARLAESASPKLAEWQSLYRHLGKMNQAAKEAELKRLIAHYVNDVVGNFNPRVYRFATRAVPIGLSLLLRPQLNFRRLLDLSTVRGRICVEGELELLRSLINKGTLILVPTHLSNLDSIVVGWSLYANGLPPFIYGAGKNLFFNPLISFFMHNLGAYRVERNWRFTLYKDVLKTYSQVLLERGYHSLFFPGGTRSRSGEIERKLKLGLLGTGLAAGIRNLQAGLSHPGIFVVPCTINYQLVLEAETLIDDHLKREGQSRYIIEDDESSRFSRIWDYVRKTLALDASLIIRYGAPLDLWGNRVDAAGISHDRMGRPIDTRRYLLVGDEIKASPQRDAEYVIELGEQIVQAFQQNTVVLVTHLVAYAIFSFLRRSYPQADLYTLIRLPQEEPLSSETVWREVDLVRGQLLRKAEEAALTLSEQVRKGTVEEIVNAALHYFSMYHQRPVLRRVASGLQIMDMKLLLYYHNRLTGYGIERLGYQAGLPLARVRLQDD
ncbi:MAG: 1-acyl-sn-glycerol-3-phosphate acyltransferase [Cyanobacteria bacterium NC_groundwater_1444_Ag_S-0.65um_54_12]|nr:1-acyl-sn-glycerol-3-phosphate acyltransferase [Cyanobacteria bacterium NC_groundwater_1444_Ag_S-0.65um_54_12]